MNSPTSGPVVNVIVRTLGRDSLAYALASLAAQSWRPLEVIVVDASGRGGLDTAAAGKLPVRVLNAGPLARAAAANAGLQAATGDWLAFLDDDDRVEPDHLANLFAALEALPGARFAYSQSVLLDGQGHPVRKLGGPFDRFALFRSNYIPIHAALFARSLLAQGARFDESLAMFEDWDLWLQFAQQTAFAFAPRPTAIYYAATGDSGAGGAGNQDREALLANRNRLAEKWGAEQARILQKARHATERARALLKAGRPAEAAVFRDRALAFQFGEVPASA